MPIDRNQKNHNLQRDLMSKKDELKRVEDLFVRNNEKIRAKKFRLDQVKKELSRWEKEFETHDKDLQDLNVYRIREERNMFMVKTEIKNLEDEIRKNQSEINRGLIHGF